MSTALKVCSGLLLLVIGGAAGALIAKGGTTSPAAPSVPALAGKSSTATSPEDVASFLRRVRPTFQEASSACFAAEQCGSLEREPKRGALASANEIPACLRERIPACGALSEKLTGFVPPAAIIPFWGGTLQFRVARALQHSLLTSQLVVEANGPPAMTIPASKSYVDVEDWVAKQHLPIAAKYAALRETAAKWQQDTIALDDWILAHDICSSKGVRCTLDRALAGR